MYAASVFVTFLAFGSIHGAALLGSEQCTWGPGYWCTDLGSARQCNAVNHCITSVWKNQKAPPVDTDDCCSKCETAINRLRNEVTITEQDAVILLNSACDAVPFTNLRQQCRDGVKTYVKDVIDMIIAKIDAKRICTLVRMCKKSLDPKHRAKQLPTYNRVSLGEPTELKLNGNADSCELCKSSVVEAKNYISDAKHQQEIVQFIKNEVCAKYPQKDECEAIIDEYSPTVFRFLTLALNADTVCQYMGMCGQEKQEFAEEVKELLNFVHLLKNRGNGQLCDGCKQSVAKIRAYIANPKFQAALKKLLETQLCLLCPAKDKCKAKIASQSDEIFKKIDALLAGGLCQKIGFCPKEELHRVQLGNTLLGGDTETCEVCKFSVLEAKNYISDVKHQKEIVDFVKNEGCARCPAKDKCESAVDEYAPPLFKLLTEVLDGEQVCDFTGLCGQQLKHEFAEEVKELLNFVHLFKNRGNGQLCDGCKQSVAKIRAYIANPKFQAALKKFLSTRLCVLCPAKDKCKAQIASQSDEVFKKIDALLAGGLCQKIGFCPKEELHIVQLGNTLLGGDTETCEVCKFSVLEAKNYISDVKHQKLIVQFIKSEGCARCPAKDKCESAVDEYAAPLFKLLNEALDGERVCDFVGLCGQQLKHEFAEEVKELLKFVHLFKNRSNGQLCDGCKQSVAKIRAYIANPKFQAALKKLLSTRLCALCPAKDKCKAQIESQSDEVFKKIDALLAGGLCQKIGFCPKEELHRVQLGNTLLGGDTETCEVCKFSVLEAKNYISDVKHQKLIVQFIKSEGCARCPAKDKCESAVDEYAPPLFKLLTEALDGEQVCDFVGLCGQQLKHEFAEEVKELLNFVHLFKNRGNGQLCDGCKQSVAKIRAYIANPKFQAALKKLLSTRLCALCPAKDKCKAQIESESDEVFKKIDALLAGGLCQKIGFCPKSAAPITAVGKLGGPQCTICEFALRELDQLLAGNRTEQAIIAALDKLCGYLPKTVNDQCVSFVNEYGKMVIELLVQELAPEQVCTALGLCSGAKQVDEDTTLRFSPLLMRGAPMKAPEPKPKAVVPKVKFGPQCALCEFIMTKLDSLLAKNSTEQDIIHALDKVCSIMPGTVGDECQKMVDEYGPAIIKILASELRPAIVCTVLGLCAGNDVPMPAPKSTEFCEACETMMAYVDSLLKENATQEDVEHLLLKVCNFLPEKIRPECNMVVMLYTPEMIQLLINKLSPKLVCTEIKLCGNEKSAMTSPLADGLSNEVPLVPMKAAQLRKNKLVGVDSSKCMYGPTYWCASRYNAKKCRMTAYCTQKFWNRK